MKKFMTYVKVVAFLWMSIIITTIMLLPFPIFIILPESAKVKINNKFEKLTTWLMDRGDNLIKEL